MSARKRNNKSWSVVKVFLLNVEFETSANWIRFWGTWHWAGESECEVNWVWLEGGAEGRTVGANLQV